MRYNSSSICAVIVALVCGILLRPASSHAGVFEARCAFDSLDKAQAQKRLEWARRCGTTKNIGSPTNNARRFLTGGNDANGIPLWEYSETDDANGKNSYSGKEHGYINTIFTQYLYSAFPNSITASTDVNGFQKWSKSTLLNQPQYPTFMDNVDINSSAALFPNPKYLQDDYSDCTFYKDINGTQPASTSTSGFYVSGWCTSSCYIPEQKIHFADGDERIIDAITTVRLTGLTTVAPNSTLSDVQLQTDDVATYTRDLRDSTQVIVEIRTASGGELRVTTKHPVLRSNGRIVEAASLKAGHKLIKADGSLDRIVSVTETTYFGKVYNLKPKSTNRTANILVAQGYLVGSSRYQNEDVDYINRIILNQGIPLDVIPQ